MAAPAFVAGDVLRIRDTAWSVASCTRYEDVSILDVRGCGPTNAGEHARFLVPFETVERVRRSLRPRAVRPRRWRRAACDLLARSSEGVDDVQSAVDAGIAVLPFQLEPALAVAGGLACRLLVADDVGLGKTIQAAMVVAETLRRCPSEARALIVCPAGLREQWESELRARFGLDAAVLDAAAVSAAASAAGLNPWAAHTVVITSIDYVKRPEIMRALEGLVWDVAVFDEAHALSGRSDRRTAAAALADRARVVVLLTATPHSGDDEAFARLASLGSLGGRTPLCVFRRTRADVGLAAARRTRWARVHPTDAERQMHDELAAYVRLIDAQPGGVLEGVRLVAAVLTRRAWSSAASLCRSLERRLQLLDTQTAPDVQIALPFTSSEDDEEPGLLLAVPGLIDRSRECRLLERLLASAREAARAESKLRALDRLLRRARQPAIVFTEYRDTLATLEAALAHHEPVALHGGMPAVERRENVRRFTAGTARLLLATDAASEGLNLHQRCRLVVNLELPWTPLRLEQRVGRVERIGQSRRVHAIHLLCAGTSEEAATERLASRIGRIAVALGALEPPSPGSKGDDGRTDVGPAMPPGVIAPDLRGRAAREAERIASARALAAGPSRAILHPAARPVVQTRAAVTWIRRRAPRVEAFWVFRLAFADEGGRPAGEALLALRTAVAPPPCSTAHDVAAWFTDARRELEPVVGAEHERLLRSLEASTRAPLLLAIAREDAILDTLAGRRARMAAAMLQRGLFDRRTERAAAAQAAVLEEAVSRCTTRRSLLASRERLATAERELGVAVLLGRR